MTRKEMLGRLDEGENPLELSIEKWKDIVEGKGDDNYNCALCAVNDDCRDCIADSNNGCCNGYYNTWADHHNHHKKECSKCKELATNVYNYLCGLREEK